MLKTFDRYCLMEFMVMLMVGTTLPAGLLFFTDKIKDLQMYMKDFGCPFDLYVLMTAMQLPDIIVHCLPAGVLIATVLVLYRMMSDSEMIGLQTSGVSLRRIFQPFLLIGLGVGVFAFIVNETVVPKSLKMSQKLALLAAKRMDLPEAQGINDFKGIKKDNSGKVKEVYLIADRQGNNLANALLFQFPQENTIKLTYAPKGHFKAATWQLFDGQVYDLVIGQKGRKSNIRNTHFKRMSINPPSFAKFDPDKREPLPSELNSMQLLAKMNQFRLEGKPTPIEYELNFHYNLASPLTCLFIVIASFPIGLVGRRRHKTSISLCYAGFLLVSYFSIEQVGWALARNGYIPIILAVWFPGLLIATIGAILIYWNSKK